MECLEHSHASLGEASEASKVGFSSQGNASAKPKCKRQQYNELRRLEVAKVRKVGACNVCRQRKVRNRTTREPTFSSLWPPSSTPPVTAQLTATNNFHLTTLTERATNTHLQGPKRTTTQNKHELEEFEKAKTDITRDMLGSRLASNQRPRIGKGRPGENATWDSRTGRETTQPPRPRRQSTKQGTVTGQDSDWQESLPPPIPHKAHRQVISPARTPFRVYQDINPQIYDTALLNSAIMAPHLAPPGLGSAPDTARFPVTPTRRGGASSNYMISETAKSNPLESFNAQIYERYQMRTPIVSIASTTIATAPSFEVFNRAPRSGLDGPQESAIDLSYASNSLAPEAGNSLTIPLNNDDKLDARALDTSTIPTSAVWDPFAPGVNEGFNNVDNYTIEDNRSRGFPSDLTYATPERKPNPSFYNCKSYQCNDNLGSGSSSSGTSSVPGLSTSPYARSMVMSSPLTPTRAGAGPYTNDRRSLFEENNVGGVGLGDFDLEMMYLSWAKTNGNRR